jgi:sulfite reductase (NADPH) hemoprotein beta-component
MITPEAAKLTRNEGLKHGDPALAGTIAETLANETVDSFTPDDYEFLKFHGVYQQDDRDKRKQQKQFIFMVRTKFPGGRLSADQYLACDRLAREYGNQTLRITTRQDFQFHGVIKKHLRQTIASLNQVLITTIAACGDVERNVMAPPTPSTGPLVDQMLRQAKALSDALAPETKAYHRIWLDGQELPVSERQGFVDSLYGSRYLPRKFKTAFAIPPLNDIDIFTNDLGFIAIVEGGRLLGYNLIAGGGMGMSHGNTQTFPRLADVIGFLTPEHVETAAKTVITMHRDFGDRTNRKHARLKYIIEERGVAWFKEEFERRAGIHLEPARPYQFARQGDLLGWHAQADGNYFLGLFVENGRIRDAEGYQLLSGLRKVIEEFRTEVRLTPSQNILLIGVAPEARDRINERLREHGISPENPFSATRRASMACPALPTCGLSLAESERIMPEVLTRIEGLLGEVGLASEEIVVRMTGCPNGCARPYLAEIGFVGKAPNKYQIYLGGNEGCTRLNWLYKDSVKNEDIVAELRPLLVRFATERQGSERFGDFCERVIRKELPLAAN